MVERESDVGTHRERIGESERWRDGEMEAERDWE
jgi:hypothetical protein